MNSANKRLLLLGLLLVFVGWPRMSLAVQADALSASAAAQERVIQLIQDALGIYRIDSESDSAATNRASARLLSLVASFREASVLMPDRLDLRLGLASALIQRALRTNSHFELDVRKALAVYRQVLELDPNGFEAPLQYAAYARAIRDDRAADEAIRHLQVTHPQWTSEYLDRFRRAEAVLTMPLNTDPPVGMPNNRSHAIVVLGAALDTDGLMKPKLVGRLRQALQVARLYPEAPLVLTGGNPQAGLTEAYLMRAWLLREGLSADRLHLEDKARDTLANAFYSAAILQKLKVTHVTLVTSATHIRRGLADLEEACAQRALNIAIATVAAPEDQELDSCRERIAVYRDTLRVSGIWAFPGIQR